MNAVIEMPKSGIVPNAGRMSVTEVTQHAIAVQEVMKAVMKKDVHYGVIPFTDKPTLYKAGAEVLCMTFRIADSYRIEDLSTDDAIRYRVTCVGTHQLTGVELGSGMGEGSTSEEKYKWRKAVNKEEFEATPVTMRRVKFAKNYKVEQVRTEPADLANTVLKMACKRAKMAMVLNVTAASDCFTQDIEDLSQELREHLVDDEGGAGPAAPPAWPAESFALQMERWGKAVAAGIKTPADILAMARSKGVLTPEQEKAITSLKKAEAAPAQVAEQPATEGAAE
jgi:hypothetical protein